MNVRLLRVVFIPFFLIFLNACNQPTYSKDNLKESIINLCKDEYGLDVEAKILDSTLGVFIPVEGLVGTGLRLDEDAGEKIENVALSMHRVMMSTDKPLKIYNLTARDTKTLGAEFTLTGFVYDVIRVRLLDISRGEYHKRILRDFKFNPVVIGGVRLKELFEALNKNSPSVEGIKTAFYPIYRIGKKGSQKIEIVELSAKEISDHEALFYVKTKEYCELLPDFETYRSIFPPGFNNEYLFILNISMFPNPIKEIVSRYFYSGTEIRERDLKETFSQYKDTGYIGVDGFPKEDLDTGWFLSQQIARRIKMLFEEDKYLKENFKAASSQGSLINNKILRLEFSIMPNKASPKNDEIIFSSILKLAGNLLYRYEFEDFEGVELIDIKPGGRTAYLSKVDLERFRKGEKGDGALFFNKK